MPRGRWRPHKFCYPVARPPRAVPRRRRGQQQQRARAAAALTCTHTRSRILPFPRGLARPASARWPAARPLAARAPRKGRPGQITTAWLPWSILIDKNKEFVARACALLTRAAARPRAVWTLAQSPPLSSMRRPPARASCERPAGAIHERQAYACGHAARGRRGVASCGGAGICCWLRSCWLAPGTHKCAPLVHSAPRPGLWTKEVQDRQAAGTWDLQRRGRRARRRRSGCGRRRPWRCSFCACPWRPAASRGAWEVIS